jgi:two-component system, NtrC family, sensor histidine kinase HydH
MDKEEYDTLIKKQGVHSLMISLSTDEMRRAVRSDWLLRSLVSLLASGTALVSALAWRNVTRTSELQIRLVKAGEMNSHLSQMNFAAAGLAHETRNPLNLIRGIAQMIMLQARDAPKLKDHASTIIEEADRVTVQLNEFIDYSKPREAHLSAVEVTRLVTDVGRTLLPDIEDKQIVFQPPREPLTIAADEQLLRQALFNLLLNAVQAVEPGGLIEVRWSTVNASEAALEIADNGPGVPPAERANIFKPYVTMRPKGVGLGLAIVHQIVSAHGWDIVCEENAPRGAVFRIRHLKLAAAGGGLSS